MNCSVRELCVGCFVGDAKQMMMRARRGFNWDCDCSRAHGTRLAGSACGVLADVWQCVVFTVHHRVQ